MKQKFILLLLFLIPFYVKADTISINCPNEVNINTEFSCEVIGNTTDGVNDVKFSIGLSDNLKFITFVNGNGFNGAGEQELVALYSSKTYKESFKIGTLKLKTIDSGNGSISLNSVFFYLDGKNSINPASKNITIVKPVNNTNNSNNNKNNTNNNNTNNNNTNNNNNSSNNGSNSNKDNVDNNQNSDEDDRQVYLSNIKI